MRRKEERREVGDVNDNKNPQTVSDFSKFRHENKTFVAESSFRARSIYHLVNIESKETIYLVFHSLPEEHKIHQIAYRWVENGRNQRKGKKGNSCLVLLLIRCQMHSCRQRERKDDGRLLDGRSHGLTL